MSLPPEILKKVALLEIMTRKLVNNLFAGEYHSAFKGQGMTFSEFREYVPGDDVRHISWPVTARTGKPYIKKFDEERELTLMLAVDISGSSDFGTAGYIKGEAIAHLAAVLSFSAAKNNDAIGLLLFSNQVELYVPPKKGRGQVHRILRELYYFKPKNRQTKMSAAFDHLLGVLKKRAHIFVFSDFFDNGFEESLRMIGKKHDTVAVVVNDPLEEKIPELGIMDLHDAETGEVLTVDTSSYQFQKEFAEGWNRRKTEREKSLRLAQIDRIDVKLDKDLVQPLIDFFHKRNRRG